MIVHTHTHAHTHTYTHTHTHTHTITRKCTCNHVQTPMHLRSGVGRQAAGGKVDTLSHAPSLPYTHAHMPYTHLHACAHAQFTVGLVGKPSAGKSTFFNALVSPEKEEEEAKVGAFPFTTIDANLVWTLYMHVCMYITKGARGGQSGRHSPYYHDPQLGLDTRYACTYIIKEKERRSNGRLSLNYYQTQSCSEIVCTCMFARKK